MSNKKILVVDDSADMRIYVEVILNKLGYEMLEACDGIEAIEKTIEQKPDIILMDIMMPNMDGIEATLTIKNNPKTKKIPIIMLTALLDSNVVMKSYDYGADYYLNKPFDKEQLTKAIHFVEKMGDEF